MAWAQQSPTSKLWRGCYRVDPKAKPSYTLYEHRTKSEAVRAGSEAEGGARRRPGHDPHGARTLWGAWVDEWWSTRIIEASTRQSCESSLKHVRARWGATPIGTITRHSVQAWVTGLPLAASSVRQPYYLLSASLRAAVAHGLIDVNPCIGIELPVVPPAEERFLTDGEVAGLRANLDGQWRLLFELLLGAGLRIGEAAGLHWHRVDLDAGTIRVAETWSRAGSHMKAYPKGRRLRTIPLRAELVARLQDWGKEHPPAATCGHEHVAYGRAPSRRGVLAPCRSSLVVTNTRGNPVSSGAFGETQWAAAVEAAGIAHCTPHALRHTYASRLLTGRPGVKGVEIARVSKLLGHSSIKITERYAYVMDDGWDEVRAALGPDEGAEDAARDAAVRPTRVRQRRSREHLQVL